MAVNLKAALIKVQSHLASSGYFPSGVTIGEPKDAPDDVLASVRIGDGAHISTTLTKSIERRDIIIRVYIKKWREPMEDTEFLLDDIMTKVEADLLGNFQLGVTGIRNIEATLITSRTGHLDVGGTMFRILDIVIPLTIDDSATFAA